MEPDEAIKVMEKAVKNPLFLKISDLMDDGLTYPERDKKLLRLLEGYRSGYFVLGFGFGGGVCVVVLKLLGVV